MSMTKSFITSGQVGQEVSASNFESDSPGFRPHSPPPPPPPTPSGGRIHFKSIQHTLQCTTEPCIVTIPLSQYDLNNA